MKPWPTKHLTADDLDAFHSEAPHGEMQLHLETCDDCRYLVAADRELVELLGRLPAHQPPSGFADRVMARVALGELAPVPVLSYPKLTRARVTALTALAAGILLSVAWSTANRGLLDGWLNGLEAAITGTGWTALRAAMASLVDQPWYETGRRFIGTPGRVAMAVAATLALYLSGLAALRRLITPSATAVSNAGV